MRQRWQSQDEGPEMVTAAEIAAWVYCPGQWRLQYGQGLEPGNRQVLEAETRHHEGKASLERATGCALVVARGAAAAALVVLVIWLWR